MSIFILLIRRKAMEALIRRAKQLPPAASVDAKVLLSGRNFLFLFFSFFTKIWLKFRTACQDFQAGESVVICLS